MPRLVALLAVVLGLAPLPAAADAGRVPPHGSFPVRQPASPPQVPGVVTETVPAPAGGAVLGEWTHVPRTWPVETAGGGTAYDAARDEVVTFGGCCFQGETWLFGDGAWRQAHPSISPGPRASNVMSYDPLRQEVVMVGGSQYGETWTWDGTAWEIHTPVPAPSFRNDAAIAFMPKIGKVVLFGGYPDLDPNELGTQLGDTWTWDGSAWQQLATPTSPPDRYGAGLAVDPATGDLVLFGGLSDSYTSLGDTWAFDGTQWRQVATDAAPSPRSYLQLATNAAAGAVELFGGYDLEHGLATLGDRWFFTDGRWTQELPGIETGGQLPPARLGGGFVADTTAGSMFLFGGSCDPTCGGVWIERLVDRRLLDGTIERRLEWTELRSPWPKNRMSAGTMVADPLGRGTLMHGGFGDSFGTGEPNDTWIWDGAWTELQTENAPPGRQGLSLAAHPATDTVVLFGGLTSPIEPPDDTTWVLDGTTWEAHRPDPAPPGRYHTAMAEDRNGDLVLFGGFAQGGTKLGDTWIWDGERWRQHVQAGGPAARSYPHMVYDPVRRETVLFGGSDASGVTVTETWAWDGSSWQRRSPAVSPIGRLGAAMTWDPASRRAVLFGGASCVSLACAITNDVWTWDGTTWAKHESPQGGPAARWFSLAGPTESGLVLFGGHGGGSGLPMSDTWLWRSTL